MNTQKFKLPAALALSLSALSNSAVAENAGGWEYSIAPLYVWARSIDGNAGIGRIEDTELEMDFNDDILDNLDMTFAVHMEAKQGPLVFYGEYNYARLDPSSKLHIGPISIKGEVEYTETLWELGFRYEVADTGSTQWEVIGGVRGLDVEIDVKLDRIDDGPGSDGPPKKNSGGDDWVQGLAGLRTTTQLTESWDFVFWGDYAYGGSDSDSYKLQGTANYRFNDWGVFMVGYRHIGMDHVNAEHGDPNYYKHDLDNSGPILGINIIF